MLDGASLLHPPKPSTQRWLANMQMQALILWACLQHYLICKRGLKQCVRINDGISKHLTYSSQIPPIAIAANCAFMTEMYKTVDARYQLMISTDVI